MSLHICAVSSEPSLLSNIEYETMDYASSLAPHTIFHIYICNLANSEDPEEMSYDASFHEGPHCLLLLSSTKTVF